MKLQLIAKKTIIVCLFSVITTLPFPSLVIAQPTIPLLQISSFFSYLAQRTPATPKQATTPTTAVTIATPTTTKGSTNPEQSSNAEYKVQTTNNQLQSTTYPTSINIPSLHLTADIDVVGYTTVNGARTWEVPQANVGTPQDGIENNLILMGHTGSFSSVFGKIKGLQPGDTILLPRYAGSTKYAVVENTIVDVTDLRYIMPQDTPRLTLITCVEHDQNSRRIIVALPV